MTIYVDPPPSGSSRFGLLEAATVVTGGDPHRLMGVQYQPECGTAHLTIGDCFPVPPPVDSDEGESDQPSTGKITDDGIQSADGVPFAVYHLFACRPIGGGDLAARARASFELAEGLAVEQWFGEYLTDHPDALDITPGGTSLNVIDGLAWLEGFAGSVYGGQATIHGDRTLASALLTAGALSVNGGRLETNLGSRFAAGGGYAETLGDPAGGVTLATDGWLYATGPVGFWRGEVDLNDAFQTSEVLVAATNPGVGTALHNAINETRVLVERQYVGATSCLVAGIKVSRSACCSEAVQ